MFIGPDFNNLFQEMFISRNTYTRTNSFAEEKE